MRNALPRRSSALDDPGLDSSQSGAVHDGETHCCAAVTELRSQTIPGKRTGLHEQRPRTVRPVIVGRDAGRPRSETAEANSVSRATRVVSRAFAIGALFLFVVSAPILMLWLDVRWLRNTVGEISATELMQLACIGLTAASFARLAQRSHEDRGFATLAAGFFACMLIRELDAVLDMLVDGLWQGLVAIVAVSCVTYAALRWRLTLRGMARLLISRFGLVMTIGLALLLAYSRLLGKGALWQDLLEDGYVRVVKNAVEESAELLGDTLILIAGLGYVGNRLRRLRRRASALC